MKVSGGAQYTISGQIKTEDFLGANKDLGAMFFLFDFNRSPVVNGTTDWTSATMQHVVVPAGKTASFRLITYGPVTTGNAWFANISVQQEIPPGLQMFLLYPNYRGLMFSDQSQPASMDLIVTPPAGTTLGTCNLNSTRLIQWQHRASHIFRPPRPNSRGPRLGPVPDGSLQLLGNLEDTSGNVLMAQTPVRDREAGRVGARGMKAWIDPANRAHFNDGHPHFVLGIYDTTG